MVLEAGDHQKTQEDIDFMLINGLIIILHRFWYSFDVFIGKTWPKKYNFWPIVDVKASTYYASGGQNPFV